ncbi:MAG TPA: iron-sulfur cluster carrier protein ApbC [Gammaproteobacteria bacterium]|nr:iron-sulfur cluster carrier protein ApbC [Gammaproteobacteria bacterium]
MGEINKEVVTRRLATVIDPHTDSDLVAGKSVTDISVDGVDVKVRLTLGYPAKSWHGVLKEQVTAALADLDGLGDLAIDIDTDVVAHEVQKGVTPINGVRNIIAIASGKGGVGKSTVAVNLALALSSEGATVGILDADIYGPSQPRMLGVNQRPESVDGKTLEPLVSYQVQVMSIGFLIDEDSPMIWRGPMVTQALEQLLNDTRWKDLDYLVVDLPPGTGDIQLTLAQKVPVSGAVIVTTPQNIALLDARKGLKMFEKVEIPVLGVIENMSTHICSECGHEEHIFGAGGGKRMADDYDVEHLGNIPLDSRIRADADAGRPTVVADPDGAIADIYRQVARRVGGKLAVRKRNYSDVFPSIVIENN